MSGALVKHEIRTRRSGALILALVLAAFGLLALLIGDALGSLMAELSASFPESLRTFIGADAPGGYVIGELFSLEFPIAVVVFIVVIGAQTLAGEEQAGTMALLSAQPVSRSAVVWAKTASLAWALAPVVGLNWVVMALFIHTGGTELTLRGLTGVTVHLAFLGMTFGAIALAGAAATGRPIIGSALASGVATVSYLAATILPIAGFGTWARLSPWYYYLLHSDPLRTGIAWPDIAVFMAIVSGALMVATFGFRRRDLLG